MPIPDPLSNFDVTISNKLQIGYLNPFEIENAKQRIFDNSNAIQNGFKNAFKYKIANKNFLNGF